MGIRNNIKRKRFEEKSTEKSMKNEDFPMGYPSWQCSRPDTLNFGVKYTEVNLYTSLTSVKI